MDENFTNTDSSLTQTVITRGTAYTLERDVKFDTQFGGSVIVAKTELGKADAAQMDENFTNTDFNLTQAIASHVVAYI